MSCCEPPCTCTVPKSTLMRRFLAAGIEPELSCAQLPPSRWTPPCCASAAQARDNSTVTVPANLENCFNLHLVFVLTPGAEPHFLVEGRAFSPVRKTLNPFHPTG